MNPFNTPKSKKFTSTSSSPSALQQSPSVFSAASSLVPCPICQKSIPEWFINNHLDNDCKGMDSVVESLTKQSSSTKRRLSEMEDFDDIDEAIFRDMSETDDKDKEQPSVSQSPDPEHELRDLQKMHQQQQQQRQRQWLQKLQQNPAQLQQHQSFSSNSRNERQKANVAIQRSKPLAERARPTTLDDYIGQKELIGPGGILRALVLQDTVPSIILWGPCGVGKTTLARIIANTTKAQFKEMSATAHGVGDLRKAFEDAKNLFQLTRQRTIIFLDEIHRFTKAQQDIFLPFVEKGTITLIGATTENPSFRINNALLSRCRVLTLEKLSLSDGMDRMIRRAARIKWHDILDMAQEQMSQTELEQYQATIGKDECSMNEWIDGAIEEDAVKWLIDLSDGDGRAAINTLEIAIQAQSTLILSADDTVPRTKDPFTSNNTSPLSTVSGVLEKLMLTRLTADMVRAAFQKTHLQYDRQGDEHYNLISALHKSIRGGDANAALYWLGRMLVAGEEPLYIARRLIRLASEDIGVADSSALPLAIATYQACQMIGMPECDVNLAHCVVHMANAKKSVDVYHAYGLVKQTIAEEFAYPVPIHLRNAPTSLMKDLGYGHDYKYPPNYPEGVKIDQEYLPRGLKTRNFLGKVPVMRLGDDGEWQL